jgi:hypothetical protein
LYAFLVLDHFLQAPAPSLQSSGSRVAIFQTVLQFCILLEREQVAFYLVLIIRPWIMVNDLIGEVHAQLVDQLPRKAGSITTCCVKFGRGDVATHCFEDEEAAGLNQKLVK